MAAAMAMSSQLVGITICGPSLGNLYSAASVIRGSFGVESRDWCGGSGRQVLSRWRPAKAIPREFLQLAEDLAGLEDGPIELPADFDPLGNVSEFSPLQIAGSFVLTGSLAVLLYRAVQKRIKRVKDLQFRSKGVQQLKVAEKARKAAILGLKQEPAIPTPPPSALQTLSGALVAGAIALVLYRFSTTVQAGFELQPVSTNYSIRNITITVRTIINGICYLSTFVFAANSVGLTLYTLQLAFFPPPDPDQSSSGAGQIEEDNEGGEE